MSNYFAPDQLHYQGNIDQSQTLGSRGNPAGHYAPAIVDQWDDVEPHLQDPQPQDRSKERSRKTSGQEHVKHRRTRSGCYKCRERRVKCDEARPICERCRKGSRECVYPEPRPVVKPSSKTGKGRTVTQNETTSSSDDDDDEEEEAGGPQSPGKRSEKVQPANKSHKTASRARRRSQAASGKMARRANAQTLAEALPSVEQAKDMQDKSLSPRTDDSSEQSATRSTPEGPQQRQKFSSVSTASPPETSERPNLPANMQSLLDYHMTLTHHHYLFKHEASDFIHKSLVEHALKFEPLLYAIVGFAAFHRTVRSSRGKIQDFLGYYNKSVSLLRKSLFETHHRTHATLLTILQLATFEEYLGDWVNLLGHQKAACGILIELFTPSTILESEEKRKTLEWYLRFDLRTGLMAGHELVLGREWFSASSDYYLRQVHEHPDSIYFRIENAIASHRVMAYDMAMLFARLRRGEITIQKFTNDNEAISQRISSWLGHLGSLLTDDKYLVHRFDKSIPKDPDDIVDAYVPRGLYHGEMFAANFMSMDWTSLEMVHKYQTSVALKQPPPPDLPKFALEICRIFQAIEYWPHSPPGAVLAAQASVGIAAIFLPKDDKHSMWCRRKLAKIESLGYIYPLRFRSNLAGLWGQPEVLQWWLPNNEDHPTIIQDIRAFIQDRASQPHLRTETEDLREMRAIFTNMNLRSEHD